MREETTIVSKAALVADFKQLKLVTGGIVTRDYYRQNGRFSESEWHKVFPTWAEFSEAAGAGAKAVEPAEKNEMKGDIWEISLPKTNIHTLEQLIEYCKIDLSIWEVERFVANKWDANAGGGETMPLFQIKAFLKKKLAVIALRKEIEALRELAIAQSKTPKRTLAPQVKLSGNVLEINIPDVHFGKLSWPKETGYEPYDTDIAEVIYFRALEAIIERSRAYKFDEILFVVGNDLFNSDNMEGETTKGTKVTTDIRYHKTFSRVRTAVVKAIERLREIAPVRVVMVYGNHDQLASWHLGDSLQCYFHKYTDVTIDNVPRYRKYIQYGNVMLMFTHGDKGKRQDYPLLMATEQPEMFGATKFREAHTGHTHMTKLDEQHGVRVRVLPALCPPDDWHSENGFVGNLRNAEGYIWNKEEGLIGMVFYCDNAFPTVVTERVIEYREK